MITVLWCKVSVMLCPHPIRNEKFFFQSQGLILLLSCFSTCICRQYAMRFHFTGDFTIIVTQVTADWFSCVCYFLLCNFAILSDFAFPAWLSVWLPGFKKKSSFKYGQIFLAHFQIFICCTFSLIIFFGRGSVWCSLGGSCQHWVLVLSVFSTQLKLFRKCLMKPL